MFIIYFEYIINNIAYRRRDCQLLTIQKYYHREFFFSKFPNKILLKIFPIIFHENFLTSPNIKEIPDFPCFPNE